MGVDDSVEEKKAEPKVEPQPFTADAERKLQEVENKTFELKKELQAAKGQCIKDMLRSVKDQITEARKAFLDKELLGKKLRDDKTTGWNNIVKECKSIKF